jgi:hypothetical protein
MKSRIVFVTISAAASLAAAALLVFLIGQAAPAAGPFGMDHTRDAAAGGDGSALAVSRVISIPFGIDASLQVSEGGQIVTVTGHGDCQGGETFRVTVKVSQDAFNGLAVGHTEGDCTTVESEGWSVQVNTPGSKTFSEGAALACGRVVVHFDQEGAIVHDWCKEVTLQ